jgi:hypothetical protein
MPHTCRSRYPSGAAQLGGNRSFADTRRGDRVAPILECQLAECSVRNS